MYVSFLLTFSVALLTLTSAERVDNTEDETVPVVTTATSASSQSQTDVNLNNGNQKEFGGNSYEILRTEVKQLRVLEYQDAVEACAKTSPDPSTLLVIKSQAETNFLVNWLFREQEIQRKVWLNLVRVNGTNEFVWANEVTQGQTDYTNWHKCEPNDITVTQWNSPNWPENCVEMYPQVYPYPD